jgi:hypothetical protein
MKFVKCELCNAEITEEKCVFAECQRIVDGEEHYFCCKRHADQFEQKRRKTQN